MDWFNLAQDRYKWNTVMNTATNFRVHEDVENCLTN
jgi:hypothetical protein